MIAGDEIEHGGIFGAARRPQPAMLEGGGVKLPLKLAWIEFQPGDAFILKSDCRQVIRIQPPAADRYGVDG